MHCGDVETHDPFLEIGILRGREHDCAGGIRDARSGGQ
jgi:hypothetical protein